MEQRTAGGTTHIAFLLMTAALIAESLLLNHALTQYPDPAAAETLLTLSKIVVLLTIFDTSGDYRHRVWL